MKKLRILIVIALVLLLNSCNKVEKLECRSQIVVADIEKILEMEDSSIGYYDNYYCYLIESKDDYDKIFDKVNPYTSLYHRYNNDVLGALEDDNYYDNYSIVVVYLPYQAHLSEYTLVSSKIDENQLKLEISKTSGADMHHAPLTILIEYKKEDLQDIDEVVIEIYHTKVFAFDDFYEGWK